MPVHPRACGERPHKYLDYTTGNGSSPRMRGTGGKTISMRQIIRFIPAHAGNGVQVPGLMQDRSVHPRACGERTVKRYCSPVRFGSSPRMRGTADQLMKGMGHLRFIPAHAGNGDVDPLHKLIVSVHPRACGERVCICINKGEGFGSSPRMRGTVRVNI